VAAVTTLIFRHVEELPRTCYCERRRQSLRTAFLFCFFCFCVGFGTVRRSQLLLVVLLTHSTFCLLPTTMALTTTMWTQRRKLVFFPQRRPPKLRSRAPPTLMLPMQRPKLRMPSKKSLRAASACGNGTTRTEFLKRAPKSQIFQRAHTMKCVCGHA